MTLNGDHVEIERDTFVELLDNSIVSGRAPYRKALDHGEIPYSELVKLARTAEVPHPLFFAPLPLVQAQVRIKYEKLLQGVTPNTFTVNSRATIELRDIELIIKDLLRKQAFAKKHDATLTKNRIVGILRQPGRSIRDDAQAVVSAVGWDFDTIRAARTKETALETLIGQLEERQVLVSRSVRGFMPQVLDGLHFSGMTVRDSKVPYIFLAGGDHGDFQEPAGRQIFTLVLMTVLVARGVFAPVSYDAHSTSPDPGREYDIVGEILMPAAEFGRMQLDTLDSIRSAADTYMVTPSAIAVRGMRLGRVSPENTAAFLAELADEFRNRPKSRARSPKPVNAIRKYSGRSLTSRMLRAVDENRVSAGEFCRVVCHNRLKPTDLPELKAAIR